jgi:hypothetical protein
LLRHLRKAGALFGKAAGALFSLTALPLQFALTFLF